MRLTNSKWEKLIFEIETLSSDLRFTELKKVLESYGYVMHNPSGGGSYFTFRKEGRAPITIPKHDPIKKTYVELVRNVVETEEKNEQKDT